MLICGVCLLVDAYFPGLYEKQSSFFVQAKTAESIILGNAFFNGPRAGINGRCMPLHIP